jgi:WD40 repeat protein
MAALAACKNTTTASTAVKFNQQPTLLTTIPAGYEAGEITFSDNGLQVAVILQKEGKMAMSINSEISPMYEGVRSPAFHATSKQYAFVASKDGKQCVVFNGKEGELYDSVRNPYIIAEGRIVYAAQRGEKWFIVSGDKVSQALNTADPSLYVSSDGKRLAFVEQNSATKKLNLCVCSSTLKDFVRGREYDEINDVGNNPSGSHLVYRVVKDGKGAVVLFDFRQPGSVEKESVWYEQVGNFAISNNGEHIAYFGLREGKHYLVTGKNEWPCTDYAMLFDIAVSDKGNALYTGAIKQSIILSLDGKVLTDRRESIDYLTFSDDSNHSFFVTGPCPLIPTDKPVEFAYLVVDGHESKKYDKVVSPRFAPDNTHIVFRARADGKRFVVVADKTGKIVKEHSPYEAVWDFKFSPDGKSVGYGVKIGQELWWKVEKLV